MTQYKKLLREALTNLKYVPALTVEFQVNNPRALEIAENLSEETEVLIARTEAALAQPEQDDEGDAEKYAHRKDGPKPGEPFGETAVYESRTDHLAGRRSCACRGGK